ncbi:Protein kinase superfamily protein [Forsythia ovata]|uniref:non-specific serine/threonine protein kinase n=1 Tax=Forsythia ovata TaxID=205694 RepID=A0ABD1UC84_9LAMI
MVEPEVQISSDGLWIPDITAQLAPQFHGSKHYKICCYLMKKAASFALFLAMLVLLVGKLHVTEAVNCSPLELSSCAGAIMMSLPPSDACCNKLKEQKPCLCDENEQFKICGNFFNCGNITGIDYPFWGNNRPRECGYPGLKLECEKGTTIIETKTLKYRVLDINQDTQVLKITRMDLSSNICQSKFVNTTLDSELFEYASAYTNLTILYGCSPVILPVPNQFDCPVKGTIDRNGYVVVGTQIPGMCHASIVVPVSYKNFGSFKDISNLLDYVGEGFEVQCKVDISACRECKNSRGRCGYDYGSNQFTCLCPNQSPGSTVCNSSLSVAGIIPAGMGSSESSGSVLPSGSSNPEEFYKTCGNKFSCGSITNIGYPFRGIYDPLYCAYPGLVLNCRQDEITTIQIINTTYRVLGIYETTQTMRIVREDVMRATCPQDIVNTTLDYSLFDYSATNTNLTFLYGCPTLNIPGLSLVCNNGYNGVYVLSGTQGPGKCNASVVVPVLVSTGNGYGAGGSVNSTALDQVLQQGFEIRWKMDGKGCSDCIESMGRCGFNFATNRTACFCPDQPYISATCSGANGARSPSGALFFLF